MQKIKPTLHPTVPSGRIGDPNGAVWWNGCYHLFHQQNLEDPRGGPSSWGHLTSPDLVRWQRHPAVLHPDPARGQRHIFSGCARVLPDGNLGLLFTSIFSDGRPPEIHLEVARATGGGELVPSGSPVPVLTMDIHGGFAVDQWRDPFLFEHGGKIYAVCGGNTDLGGEPAGSVLLYSADNPSLRSWKFEKVLFRHPDPRVWNIECPNFFRLEDRWVLLISPHDCPQYFVGDWNGPGSEFTVARSGVLDPGRLYATQILAGHPDGKPVLLGWIRTLQVLLDEPWSGCLALPRVLSLPPSGALRQHPHPALDSLRGEVRGFEQQLPAGKTVSLPFRAGLHSPCEILLELDVAGCAGFDLLLDAGAGEVLAVHFDRAKRMLWADGKCCWVGGGREQITLRGFLDGCVFELFETGSGSAWSLVSGNFGDGPPGLRARALGGAIPARCVTAPLL